MSPESIFLQAVGFHHAQKILMASEVPNGQRERLVPPVCVLAAFTSELMLKCLICIERGSSPPHGHDLLELFDELSAPIRKRLEAMWTDYVQSHPTLIPREPELRSALAAGKKGFELIRYWHEEPKEDFAFYLCDLPDMLVKIAFELRPELAERAKVRRAL